MRGAIAPMSDLPEPVRRFLDQHITSVMQLEVLLAVRAAKGPLSTRQLIRGIGGSVDQVLDCIAALERSKLLRQIDQGAEIAAEYAAGASLEQEVAAVAEVYAKRKARMITFILRDRSTNPLESFSEAFRFRRKG